jgi:hypothetical protein
MSWFMSQLFTACHTDLRFIFLGLVQPCMNLTDVSEESITSMFRVENQPSKKPACNRWLGSRPWRWRCYLSCHAYLGSRGFNINLYVPLRSGWQYFLQMRHTQVGLGPAKAHSATRSWRSMASPICRQETCWGAKYSPAPSGESSSTPLWSRVNWYLW